MTTIALVLLVLLAAWLAWRCHVFQVSATEAKAAAEQRIGDARVALAESEASIAEQVRLARVDSLRKSAVTRHGQSMEQLAPHLTEFCYNPKDARFLGSPVDYVIFDGIDEGNLRGIIFVEIKSGNGTLNARQRAVRNLIAEGGVSFEVVRLPILTATDEPLTSRDPASELAHLDLPRPGRAADDQPRELPPSSEAGGVLG